MRFLIFLLYNILAYPIFFFYISFFSLFSTKIRYGYIGRFKTKNVLRRLSKKYLPNQIIKQPKRGFEIPLESWVNGVLKTNIMDMLSGDCYSSNFFEKGYISKIIDNSINLSGYKRANILWNFYCLEVWKKNLHLI